MPAILHNIHAHELECERQELVKLRTELKGLRVTHDRVGSACAQLAGKLRDCSVLYTKRRQNAEALEQTLQEEYATYEAQQERDHEFDNVIRTVSDFTAFCRTLGQELIHPEKELCHRASEQGERLFQRYPDLAESELSTLKTKRDRLEKTCEIEASKCEQVIEDRLDDCMGVLFELGKHLQDDKKKRLAETQRNHQLQQTIARHDGRIDEHCRVADQHLVQLDAVRNRNVALVAEEESHVAGIRKHTRQYWEHTPLRHLSPPGNGSASFYDAATSPSGELTCTQQEQALANNEENTESEITCLTSTLLEMESEARSAAAEVRSNESSSEKHVAYRTVHRPVFYPTHRELSPTFEDRLKKGQRRSRKIVSHCHPFDVPPNKRNTFKVYESLSSALPPPEEEIELKIESDTQDLTQETKSFAEVSEIQAMNLTLTTEIACLREKVEQRVLRNEIEAARTRSNCSELQEKVAEMREHEEQRWLRSEIMDLKRKAVERRTLDQGGQDFLLRDVASRADGESYQGNKSSGNLRNPPASQLRHNPVALLPEAPVQHTRLPGLPRQGEDLPSVLETPQPVFVWPYGKLPGSPVKEVWATA